MKVLLLRDVYKLGRAGDVKKVANGYGRNYLIPQGLAMLASSGALKQADAIRAKAAIRRAQINEEMSGLAELVSGTKLAFSAKAGETGKLYGSITNQMVTDALNEKLGSQIDRRNLESDPIRNVGDHIARVRLTMDLVPEIYITVTAEDADGESADLELGADIEADPEGSPITESDAEDKIDAPSKIEAMAEVKVDTDTDTDTDTDADADADADADLEKDSEADSE
jgi:large subunit ribosomal protein L9